MSDLTTDTIKKEFEENGYAGRLASTESGVADLHRGYFERNKMKLTTAGTNKERWARVVRDAIPEERKHANPSHYRYCPNWAKLAWRTDFISHFYLTFWGIIHNFQVQFILSVVVMSMAHYWSYRLYTIPLPALGSTLSCSAMPKLWYCGMLKQIQQHTYDGYDELFKFLTTIGLQQVIAYGATFIAPYRRN